MKQGHAKLIMVGLIALSLVGCSSDSLKSQEDSNSAESDKVREEPSGEYEEEEVGYLQEGAPPVPQAKEGSHKWESDFADNEIVKWGSYHRSEPQEMRGSNKEFRKATIEEDIKYALKRQLGSPIELRLALEDYGYTDKEIYDAIEKQPIDWVDYLTNKLNSVEFMTASKKELTDVFQLARFSDETIEAAFEKSKVDWKENAYNLLLDSGVTITKEDAMAILTESEFTEEDIDFAMNQYFKED